MTEKTILVIDDSATIRRLCDKELSGAGFRVLMAPTAEEGVELAGSHAPDLIILDHQLPGTTGYEVCCQLLADESTAKIPIVASSTLRKKAYAEYVDCDNVVDMLPKPYTAEALIATVENAINTAAMVVQSQCDGSAVPEVMNEMGESDLAGAFGCFGLREILDLLNNGGKSGVLEVESVRCRVFVYVDKGRIQAVTASGVAPEVVAEYLPESLAELAPVIRLTVAGRRGSDVDGLVQLLNNKVLDPRLLKKLLRLQAAVLLHFCFTDALKSFRFDQSESAPPLFQKLPLDGSLLSFLVEGALICDVSELPAADACRGYVRKAIRGQNLDRAGLSSRHMRLMSLVSEPTSLAQLSQQLEWPEDEVRRVGYGFQLAELIEACPINDQAPNVQAPAQSQPAAQGSAPQNPAPTGAAPGQPKSNPIMKVVAVISDPEIRQRAEVMFAKHKHAVAGKVVGDWMALKLLLQRNKLGAVMVELNEQAKHLQSFLNDPAQPLAGVRRIGIQPDGPISDVGSQGFSSLLNHDFNEQQWAEAVLHHNPQASQPAQSDSDPGSADQAEAVGSAAVNDLAQVGDAQANAVSSIAINTEG